MESSAPDAGGAGAARWVRARGWRIWTLRFWIVWFLAFFLMVSASKGLDPIRTAVAVLLAIAVEVWTVRIGVRAGRDGLAIVRPFSTQRLPAGSIRSLHVVRTNFAWYKVIDLQVRLVDGTAVMVPWVSWGTQLDQLMTVEPPPLPRPSQQRVLDRLAAGLGLDGVEAPPEPSR